MFTVFRGPGAVLRARDKQLHQKYFHAFEMLGRGTPLPPPWTVCYRPQQVHGEAVAALPASCLAADPPVTGLCRLN